MEIEIILINEFLRYVKYIESIFKILFSKKDVAEMKESHIL